MHSECSGHGRKRASVRDRLPCVSTKLLADKEDFVFFKKKIFKNGGVEHHFTGRKACESDLLALPCRACWCQSARTASARTARCSHARGVRRWLIAARNAKNKIGKPDTEAFALKRWARCGSSQRNRRLAKLLLSPSPSWRKIA